MGVLHLPHCHRYLELRFRTNRCARGNASAPSGGSHLFVGSIIRLGPFDVAGTPSTDPALKWSSSAPGVASVDAAGRITGKSIGSATVRVISATGFGEVMVTVSGGGASVRSWGSTTCGVASAGTRSRAYLRNRNFGHVLLG